MRTWSFPFLSFLVFTLSCLSFDNVVPQSSEEPKANKFREREATDDALGYPNLDEDELLNTQCPLHLELRWQAEMSSSIYASPLIADINSDGKVEIVVPSFVHYLEVLEGSDGDKLPGWPAFHQSTVHSSPLLYDIDKDGVREVALATYNGEVLFFRSSGLAMSDKLEIPRLKVKKDWHVGLHLDPADHSHPDVHDEELIQETHEDPLTVHKGSTLAANITNPTADHNDSSNFVPEHDALKTTTADIQHNNNQLNASQEEALEQNNESQHTLAANITNPTAGHNEVSQEEALEQNNESQHTLAANITNPTAGHNEASQEEALEQNNESQHTLAANITNPTAGHNDSSNSVLEHDTLETTSADIQHINNRLNASQEETRGQESESQRDASATIEIPLNTNDSSSDFGSEKVSDGDIGKTLRRKLLEAKDSKGDEEVHVPTVENKGGLEAEADKSFELFRDGDELSDEYIYDYGDVVDESMWGDEEWTEAQHEKLEDYVRIDAHVLCTPVIADIDNDGVLEMIVPVSYFFDRDYYDNPEHSKELGDIDIGKYVAGSIVVFNLNTKRVKWSVQLDMSRDTSKFRAYIYSSPTVVDLDGDGNLDILVGTSFGLFYVLDHKGNVREKFPLEMAEIQGAVVAADINDDGKIELVTTDAHGNVAAWTPQGNEIWETHLKSLVPQGPSIGDVDGDGHTDIVVPTASGNIFVLNGKDGSIVRPYPYRTHGRVMNQVLLVDLKKRGEKQKGLTIVTTSFDGYLYLIDGPTSCADVVDIGETSYSMVLADNVDGGDDLDLIVTTMNGNVFCFSTPSPHHPLKAWKSPNQERNNAALRFNRQGIYVTQSSRTFRDEEGKNFWVEVEIVDRYRFPSGSQAPYNVTVSLLVPGNYEGERMMKENRVFDRPGIHRVKLPTVGVRTAGTVVVEMVDRNGLYFTDDFSITFHMHYYKLLKWLLALPMFGMFGILVVLRPQESMPLPSFSRNTDL